MCNAKFIFVFAIIFLSSLISSCAKFSDEQVQKLYVQAMDAYNRQDFVVAENLAKKTEQIDKDFYLASFLKAKSLFFMEKTEESCKVFQKLVKKNPEFTEARLWLIRNYLFLGLYEQAALCLEKEVLNNTTDWRVFHLYSLMAKDIQDYEKQISMLRRAEIALSDGAKVFSEYSSIWQMLGLENRAEHYQNKAKILSGNISGGISDEQ